jgi:hypothetical protein
MRVGWIAPCALILVGVGWCGFWSPPPIEEARLRQGLSAAVADHLSSIDLSALVPGEWEMVCDAHCYDGESFHVRKYDRRFPTVSACHDGSWGLVFIASDGSFTSATGDCRVAAAHIDLHGCTPRVRATLDLWPGAGQSCPSYGGKGR